MERPPKGYQSAFTDAQLREAVNEGFKPAEIAKRFGVSRQAVYKRVNQLELTTTTAVVAPVESQRFVARNLDTAEQLQLGLSRNNRLMDACEEWLLSPEGDGRYDIGPRADEILVTYIGLEGGEPVKRRDTLSALLALVGEGERTVCGIEAKHADPRELILKTIQEGRQSAMAMADLLKMLADIRAMQRWRDVVLHAIGRVDPDVRDAVIREIQSDLILAGLLEPSRSERLAA